MLISIPIPNLITGVSQQPEALRLSSSFAALTNCWPSVVTGLNKRPPTEHVATLGWNPSSSIAGHIINKGAGYQYVVAVADGDLKVFTMNGVEQTVNFPNGKSYLSQALNPVADMRFLTFGDTTFILNRQVITKSSYYSEASFSGVTITGTVNAFLDLPAPAVGNVSQIYYVSDPGSYYQSTQTAGSPTIYGWVRQDDVNYTSVPSGAASGSTLPSPVPTTVGQVFYLQVWVGFSIRYHKYAVAVTTPGTGAIYEWLLISPAKLVDSSNGRRNPERNGSVYVTNSVANSFYAVYINNVLRGDYLTPTGVDANSAVPGTDQIASFLRSDLAAAGIGGDRTGSTITITGLQATDTIQTTTTNGDKAIKNYKDEVLSFSDLPPNDTNGRVVKVKGSPRENEDDYYVVFNDGLWEETYGYGEAEKLNENTMPHVLVREANGTWTFRPHKWDERQAGDRNSNPVPSFIGYRLNDMFLYTNRLGFVSDTNVILSESDKFENFFRTTVATLLDSDPLDFAILSAMEDQLLHAIPFNKDLLILGERSQHRFTYSQFVGPKNVQAQFTTSYSAAKGPMPVNMGGSVYFIDDQVGYSYAKLYEYYPKENLAGDEAEDVTSPVPQYVRTGVTFISASPHVKTALIGSSLETDSLYVYKFYWAGDKKIQNAWSKWQFPGSDRFYWGDFMENNFYCFIKRGSSASLERIKINEEIFDLQLGTRILLDRQLVKSQLTTSFTGGNTVITLPYSTAIAPEVLSRATVNDEWIRHQVTVVSGTQVRVNGLNITSHAQIIVGIPYVMEAEFSTPYVRQQKGQGEVVLLDARLQMRHLMIEYDDTRHFKTSLTLPGRPEVITEIFADDTEQGRERIPLMGKNTDIKLKLINDSPYASQFSSAEWAAIYQPKVKRM